MNGNDLPSRVSDSGGFGNFSLVRDTGRKRALVRCPACGRELVLHYSKAIRNKSCGCLTTTGDLTGQKFGRLTAVRRDGQIAGHHAWLCTCDCGNSHRVAASQLIKAKTKSCGCWLREFAASLKRSHGMAARPEYAVWAGMIKRCHNQNATGWYKYGARGIEVCAKWRDSFAAFYQDMGPRPSYEPGNCKWATAIEQMANRRPRSEWRKRGTTA